jgi:protein phosphatase
MPQPHEIDPSGPLAVGWMSDPGRVRDHNEDAVCAVSMQFQQGDEHQALGLFAVADGMGGHQHGELASALAIRVAADEILRKVAVPLLAPSGDATPPPLGDTMRSAVAKAHGRLRRDLPGAGTTLTVALVIEDSVAVAHVGDTRAYLCLGQEIRQLTRDHSMVQRMVEEGIQTAQQAAEDPRKNVLYRALGQVENLDVDFQFFEFPVGARLLLCCDGLWGVLPPGELERVLVTAVDPRAACAELVAIANHMGGPDNVTALMVVHHEPAGSAPG